MQLQHTQPIPYADIDQETITEYSTTDCSMNGLYKSLQSVTYRDMNDDLLSYIETTYSRSSEYTYEMDDAGVWYSTNNATKKKNKIH